MTNKHDAGESLKSGSLACAEAAIAAGCRFYAGYPSPLTSEIAEHMSRHLPQVGGHYLPMEDESGSIAAILGASSGGLRSMTATSRPNFPLVMAKIGLGVIAESPRVIVNIQPRGSDGGLTSINGQTEMMQAKSRSHSGYQAIAYAPNSVQEMFDLTLKAFKMAGKYNTPTFVLADQVVANMTGKLAIPALENTEIVQRSKAARKNPRFLTSDFIEDLPPIASARKGQHVNARGVTNEERGYLFTNHAASERMIEDLIKNIQNHMNEITEVEHYLTEDAKVVVVAYGSTSISALSAVDELRRAERKVGLLRLITPSPFPTKEIERLNAEKIIVPETNCGRMEHLVRGFASCPVVGIHHVAGTSFPSDKIYEALQKE
jgi:2-oxoglutarate ferredoxin oxidoreductase subunit alpha